MNGIADVDSLVDAMVMKVRANVCFLSKFFGGAFVTLDDEIVHNQVVQDSAANVSWVLYIVHRQKQKD